MPATDSTQPHGTTDAVAAQRDDLFSSLISDIKTYTGRDPLLPWLRGIKTMKECLPAQLLKEKLPRFLQKCTQKFESDRRYKNDIRYIRVWLQLMDYVDDPGILLKAMEASCIGSKRSLFYQAYALYYEKAKKYEEAEKVYHFGVQNFAEPMDDLKKSYDQFLCRFERNKDKKIKITTQHRQVHEKKLRKKSRLCHNSLENKENMCRAENKARGAYCNSSLNHAVNGKSREEIGKNLDEKLKNKESFKASDDIVLTKFVDTAIVGKPHVEDACHHGLVEPTINMKEAIDVINGMFSEPIEVNPVKRKGLNHSQQNENWSCKPRVFIDEDANEKVEAEQPQQKLLEIYIDEEEHCDDSDEGHLTGNSVSAAFVFPRPKDLSPENQDELGTATSSKGKFREDTVVCRFVGSAIVDDPLFENVCHHGLVDPTVNLKEAMKDINSMFGKPIDYVRSKRSKNERPLEGKGLDSGFLILPDEDDENVNDREERLQVSSDLSAKVENPGKYSVGISILPGNELELPQEKLRPGPSVNSRDLFEPTMFTKEAMDDINKMFGGPLDF
ncbi:hypothetical protein SAY86_002721 [Trapa natans]|uniref:BUB1 N-terminal domain-containing protein n=1 Tax=Trapa natans TaxID=22666 RepID=A0AAN7R195_TRANT|nr:hypothetical protein SAY86_002721 [Trapa natans]